VKISPETKNLIKKIQRDRITEWRVYLSLAKKAKGPNKRILERIAKDELKRYHAWKRYTGEDLPPHKLKIFKNLLIAKITGLTFAIKHMESKVGKSNDDN